MQVDSSYGAIAVDGADGSIIWFHGAGSQEEAERMVVEKSSSPNTAIQVWGRDSFLAIAVDEDGNYGSAWAETREAAEVKALQGCHGPNPKLQLSFHTRRNEEWRWDGSDANGSIARRKRKRR